MGIIRNYRKITGSAFEVHRFPAAGEEGVCSLIIDELTRKPLK
jgi:hypothetical protein